MQCDYLLDWLPFCNTLYPWYCAPFEEDPPINITAPSTFLGKLMVKRVLLEIYRHDVCKTNIMHLIFSSDIYNSILLLCVLGFLVFFRSYSSYFVVFEEYDIFFIFITLKQNVNFRAIQQYVRYNNVTGAHNSELKMGISGCYLPEAGLFPKRRI